MQPVISNKDCEGIAVSGNQISSVTMDGNRWTPAATSRKFIKWMRLDHMIIVGAVAGLLPLTASPDLRAEPVASSPAISFDLQADRPGCLEFFGPKGAGCFTEEISNSFQGVLALNYVSHPQAGFPGGFLNASPPSQPWSGTMWTRDAGAFLRELVFWGYYQHASQVSQCLMDFAGTNQAGFIGFPRYFAPGHPHETGTEMDGHAAIIIAMVSLWQRLPPGDPFRKSLYDFLHQQPSPVRYLHYVLEHRPLIPGSGEFGGGGVKGLYDNVVQNNLCALALLSAAEMEAEAGDQTDAALWRKDAQTIYRHMDKYLVDNNGSWIWCIDPKTLKPDPAVLRKPLNAGFGGLNGVACMSSDVLGLEPQAWNQQIVAHSEKTFAGLYDVPLRKEQFEKYGIWSQFDEIHGGLLTSPSYGQGYAIQTMLLLDKLAMADHALDFLTQATFRASDISFPHGRLSPYYFYERLYSPDADGKEELSSGCGPLNLVNVAEPLKAARLIVGVDDTSPGQVRIIPRLPPSWSGYEAKNWPILTSFGVVRADLWYEIKDGRAVFHLRLKSGQDIPALAVRLPETKGIVWKHQSDVRELNMESDFKAPGPLAGLKPKF
ncbi:MAG TPA: hypothetical protein VMF08_12000 [Candidatus Sulfotelmatobacter sp.]|nr:hypothetical protein [Candidatus Sulfotelmatobacter sp.]